MQVHLFFVLLDHGILFLTHAHLQTAQFGLQTALVLFQHPDSTLLPTDFLVRLSALFLHSLDLGGHEPNFIDAFLELLSELLADLFAIPELETLDLALGEVLLLDFHLLVDLLLEG